MRLNRAIYGTGWDGTIVLEADVAGIWTVVGAPPPPMLVNLNSASVDELVLLPMIGRTRAERMCGAAAARGRSRAATIRAGCRASGAAPSTPSGTW